MDRPEDHAAQAVTSPTPDAAKKKKKKLLIAGAVVVLVAGGAGAFFAMGGKGKGASHGDHDEHSGHAKKGGHDEHGGHAKKGEHDEHGGHAKKGEHDEHGGHAKKGEHDEHGGHAKKGEHDEHGGHAKKGGHDEHGGHAKKGHGEVDSHGKSAKHADDQEHESNQVTSHESNQVTNKGLVAHIGAALGSIQEKADTIRRAEIENDRLKLENAKLRLTIETSKFDCHASETAKFTEQLTQKLSKETGSRVARTLASLRYKLPEHLTPSQLYTLAVSYFKGREDERAAVILGFLTGLEDSDKFKSSRNFLMTAVSWYRLDNYDLSNFYLDQVLKTSANDVNLPLHAQARVWKALIAERMGKHTTSQKWLTEVVDNHPRSTEASWVNGSADSALSLMRREPASEKDEAATHRANSEAASEADDGEESDHEAHSSGH